MIKLAACIVGVFVCSSLGLGVRRAWAQDCWQCAFSVDPPGAGCVSSNSGHRVCSANCDQNGCGCGPAGSDRCEETEEEKQVSLLSVDGTFGQRRPGVVPRPRLVAGANSAVLLDCRSRILERRYGPRAASGIRGRTKSLVI